MLAGLGRTETLAAGGKGIARLNVGRSCRAHRTVQRVRKGKMVKWLQEGKPSPDASRSPRLLVAEVGRAQRSSDPHLEFPRTANCPQK